MIDFHSHILPGIDDGSKSVAMSLQMLESMKRQGIDTVAATSHFYVTQRSVRRFLFRREEAFEKLKAELPADAPRILLGAEVLYFPGISRMEELPQLCLEGTNLLLLEMPFEHWTEYAVREVRELAHSQEYTLMFAHIERYYSQQPVSVWDEFLELGVLMQSNADFFLPFSTRRKALKLLKEGRIHLLGTDAHNMSGRAPHMAEARSMIAKRLGAATLEEIDSLGEMILREGGL
ncbi:MAG: capsular polysaccharide biosynthesis protein [Oscillospiraceae bacterium]|nr:capsular polysaccharide biosynthesis protein [Oscillospiraceae bacterium]